MARLVSVKLRMEIAEYIANGGRAEEMLVEIGDAAKVAADKGTKGAKERSAAEQEAARILGKAQQDGLTGYQALGKAIDDEKTKLAGLRKDFADSTGDTSKIFGDIKQSMKDLKDLEGLAETVGADFGKGGKQSGEQFAQGFGATAQPQMMAIVAGIATDMAPVLLAAVDGAVTAGLGVAGIALGIKAASSDPRVRAAFGDLKSTAAGVYGDIGKEFAAPVAAGIRDLDGMLHADAPELRATFAVLATAAQPLIDGVGGFVDKMLPGLEDAFRKSIPFVDQLGKDLPKLGADVGMMFDDFAQGGPGAVQALSEIVNGVGALLVLIGKVAEYGGKAYGFVMKPFTDFGTALGDVIIQTKALTDSAHVAAFAESAFGAATSAAGDSAVHSGINIVGAWRNFGTFAHDQLQTWQSDINATAITVDTLKGAITDKLMGSLINADTATSNFDKSLVTLGDTLVSNGGKLTAHVAALKKSETGAQQNKDAVLAVVEANLQVYDSMISVGISSDDAAKKYDQNTRALKDQLKAAGYLPAQIQTLIGKYEGVPDMVNTTVATQGLTAAIYDLDDMIRLVNHIQPRVVTTFTTPGLIEANDTASGYARILNDIPSSKTTTVRTVYTSDGSEIASGMGRPNRWGGLYEHAAVGMLRDASVYSATSPGRYMIAEPSTHGEAFVPKTGDYGRSMSILGHAASWYGARVVPGGGGSSGPVNLTVQLVDTAGRVTRQVLIHDALGRGVPQATIKAAYP